MSYTRHTTQRLDTAIVKRTHDEPPPAPLVREGCITLAVDLTTGELGRALSVAGRVVLSVLLALIMVAAFLMFVIVV